METRVASLLAIFIFASLGLNGALKTAQDDGPRAMVIQARSSLYDSITSVFSKMSERELLSIAAEQNASWGIPFVNRGKAREKARSTERRSQSLGETTEGSVFSMALDDLIHEGFPLIYEDHLQVTCVSFSYTKLALVRIHVYDTCLYIDKNLENFWGRDITLKELKNALPGHAFHLTWFDTAHVKKAAMDELLQKNLKILRTSGIMSQERAAELVDEYGKMWMRSPELHRGSVLKQDILEEGGMRVVLDGQDLKTVSGPGIEVMVAEPKIQELDGENEGLNANRQNIFKSILRGNDLTEYDEKPPHVHIYTHSSTAG